MLKKTTKEKVLSLDFSSQIKDIEHKQAELKKLQDKISEWNQKSARIQSKFDFILPSYIIDEILENEDKKDYLNLHCLINCAIINGSISENNGKLIKQIYC